MYTSFNTSGSFFDIWTRRQLLQTSTSNTIITKHSNTSFCSRLTKIYLFIISSRFLHLWKSQMLKTEKKARRCTTSHLQWLHRLELAQLKLNHSTKQAAHSSLWLVQSTTLLPFPSAHLHLETSNQHYMKNCCVLFNASLRNPASQCPQLNHSA